MERGPAPWPLVNVAVSLRPRWDSAGGAVVQERVGGPGSAAGPQTPPGGGREVRSPARGAGAEGAGPLGGRLRAGGHLAASWLGPGRASLWTLRCFWRSCDTALAPELLFLRSGVIVPAGPVPQGAAPGSAPASPRLLGWRRRNVGRRLHPKHGAPQTGPE